MKPIIYCPCDICGVKVAEQRHHIFSQTEKNRKLYGKLIDDAKNIMYVCRDCHPKAKHMSEKEFCSKLGIETRSKSGKL
jgi:hypothetical protein